MPTWLLDGSLVLLQWATLDPTTGAWSELPLDGPAVLAAGTDRRVAALEGTRVRLLRDGAESWAVTLPAPLPPDTRVVLALSGETVYVHATSIHTGEATCWRATAQGVEPPPRCLEGSFAVLDWVIPAGPDTWAVGSHAEGVSATDLVRWTGEASELLPMPWSDLYPQGEVALLPRADGTFDLLSTCALGPEQPCLASIDDERTDERIHRYRWTPGEAPVERPAEGRPIRVPDPTSERVAWVDGKKVCVDGPDQPKRCWRAR